MSKKKKKWGNFYFAEDIILDMASLILFRAAIIVGEMYG
jgi:hypothetical protein